MGHAIRSGWWAAGQGSQWEVILGLRRVSRGRDERGLGLLTGIGCLPPVPVSLLLFCSSSHPFSCSCLPLACSGLYDHRLRAEDKGEVRDVLPGSDMMAGRLSGGGCGT